MKHLFAAIVVVTAAFSLNAEDSRRIAFQTALPAAKSPVIDGKLDDACWHDVDWNDRYWEYAKANPKRVSPGTKNAIVWDDQGLYIGIVNPETKFEKMRRNVTRSHHGATWYDDCAELYLDPDAKGVGYYKFTVNSRGCYDDIWQMDRANCYHDWNGAGVKAAANVDVSNKCWTIEIFVPWNDLGRASAPKAGEMMMFNHNRFRYTGSGWGDFCSSAPEGDYRRPENFGYVLFSKGELPEFEDIANRIAERLNLAWFIEVGDQLAYNDQEGLHFTTAADFAAKTKAAADRLKKYAALIPTVLTNDHLEVCEIPARKEQQPPTADERHSGYYIHHLARSYITPHYDWALGLDNAPKIAFGVSYYGARMRHVAELLQRVDFDCEVFTTFWGENLGGHGPYDDPISGGTPNEAESRFGNILRSRPDVIAFWGFRFKNLRSDFRYEIMRRMKDEGLGLLLVDCAQVAEFKNLKRLPEEESAILRYAPYVGMGEDNKALRVYAFGKGRLVTLNGVPDKEWDMEWRADWERRCAFLGRVLMGTARRLVTALPDGATVDWRVRNSRNEIVTSGTSRATADEMVATVDRLPAGKYTLDVTAKSPRPWWGLGLIGGDPIDFGYMPLKSPSRMGDFRIEAPHYVDDAGAFDAKVVWDRKRDDSVRIVLTLRDLPYRRLRATDEFLTKRGDGEVKKAYRNYAMPTLAGVLEAKAFDRDGKELEYAWKIVYFPNGNWPEYPQINWEGLNGEGMCEFNAKRMVEDWGWNCNLQEERQFSALFNSRGQPGYALLRMGEWGDGSVRGTLSSGLFSWNGKRCGEAQNRVNRDENPFKPEVRAIVEEEALRRIPLSRAYGHLCYNLGDECGYSVTAGYGPSDKKYFPEFLERKYGTIANYNAIRGTNYTSFAEIPHKRLKAARDQDDTQSWFDQIQYAEAIYAEAMHIHNESIMRHEPRARVGAEGSNPGDLELTVKGLKYWGPYKSRVQNEVLREISSPEVVRGVWWGGYVNEPRDGLIRLQWEFMLTGGSNCNLWYTAEIGSTMGLHNGAFEIAPYFERELPHLNALRWGCGQQLVVTPLHRQGLALWYSHESNRAAELDEHCPNPSETQNAFLEFCYRHGIGVEIITKNRLDALNRQRVVLVAGGHALTDAEIAALKAFKAKGGVVLFDVKPCTFTSWMTRRKTGDEPLAGVGPIWGEAMAATFQRMRDVAAFDAKFLAELAKYGVKPSVEIAGDPIPARTIMRLRDGADFTLCGVLFPKEADGTSHVLRLKDGPKHVYKVDGGYLGCLSEIELDDDDYPWYQFSFFDKVQLPPQAKFEKRGNRVTLQPDGLRSNGVYRIEIAGPRSEKSVWCVKDGKKPWTFDFALDDQPGEYTFTCTDLATGLGSACSIELK